MKEILIPTAATALAAAGFTSGVLDKTGDAVEEATPLVERPLSLPEIEFERALLSAYRMHEKAHYILGSPISEPTTSFDDVVQAFDFAIRKAEQVPGNSGLETTLEAYCNLSSLASDRHYTSNDSRFSRNTHLL